MYSKPTSPLPIGAVLDNGFSLFAHSIRETFGFAFAAAFLTSLVGRGLGGLGEENISAGKIVLGAIAAVTITTVLLVAVIAKTCAIQNGDRLTAAEALQVGLRRFFPAIVVALAYSVSMALGFFPAIGVALAYGVSMALGFIFLALPGIYVAVAFVFSTIAVVADRKGVIDSFRYSHALVRGRWWRTAVLLTIVTIVLLVLYFLLTMVVGVIVAIQAVGGGANDIVMPWYVDLIVMPLASGVLEPLFCTLLIAMYAEAKLRYEGSDIAERIVAAV